MKTRRTIRKYKQTLLSEEQLYNYIDTARPAPSAGNLRLLKYAVLNTKETTEKMFGLVKWAVYLAPEYNSKDSERPTAYIVICADESIRENGYDIDVGIAAENIIISAWADGVGSCLMGAIDRPKIEELLNLPDNLKVSLVIALGYSDEEQMEAEVKDGNIKYYLSNEERLCIPKRKLEEILIK